MQFIDELIARLAAAGEVFTDPPGDPVERDRQIARVVEAYPLAAKAPDWLEFLRAYGGLTYVRESSPSFSSGFFGVSYNASLHLLDGEGDPVSDDCLLLCDADPPIIADYAAFGFDATGERPWGVYGVARTGGSHWFAATFTEWFEYFVDAVV